MAWCRQATNHYLRQCWPRFLSTYNIVLLRSYFTLYKTNCIWSSQEHEERRLGRETVFSIANTGYIIESVPLNIQTRKYNLYESGQNTCLKTGQYQDKNGPLLAVSTPGRNLARLYRHACAGFFYINCCQQKIYKTRMPSFLAFGKHPLSGMKLESSRVWWLNHRAKHHLVDALI